MLIYISFDNELTTTTKFLRQSPCSEFTSGLILLGCTLEVTYLSFFLFITHTPRMVVMTASTAMIRPPTTAAEEAQTATPLPASNEVATVYE